MKANRPCGVMAACWCVGFLLLTPCLWAQEAAVSGHVGVPQDWSEHSIVFSLSKLAEHPNLIYQEPRVRHQLMQRLQRPGLDFSAGGEAGVAAAAPAQDWTFNLVRGHVPANMYPAKFSFDPGAAPSCANDYVVYGLNIAGTTGKQANLVAFNNLYSGPGGLCGSTPTVKFAYNVTTVTGSKIDLSPIISLDGTKIAFVESASKSAIFHVLTWTAGQGTISAAAAPTMTSLTFSTTTSSANRHPGLTTPTTPYTWAQTGG